MLSRRQWLTRAGAAVLAAGAAGRGSASGLTSSKLARAGASGVTESAEAGAPPEAPLALKDFQPKSMLHVPVTNVPRARFPVIDIHTHLSFSASSKNGVALGEKMRYSATPDQVLPAMDRRNLRMMVDLTGGVGQGLEETIRRFQTPHPDRFSVFTEPWWERSDQPGYSQFQADELQRAHQAGARGLKVLKTLGLYLR